MAVSDVSISNMAISWLGGNLIISLDDDTDEAALCKANYETCRDAVLEDRDWSFAIKRIILSPSAAAPPFYSDNEAGYFPLPSDFIRTIVVGVDPAFKKNINWVKECTGIFANSTILYLKYIKKVIDPTKFSAGFVQALAARLAMEIALPLTNSTDMQKAMTQLYSVKLERAGAMDGMQGQNVQLGRNTLLKVR